MLRVNRSVSEVSLSFCRVGVVGARALGAALACDGVVLTKLALNTIYPHLFQLAFAPLPYYANLFCVAVIRAIASWNRPCGQVGTAPCPGRPDHPQS